MHAALQFAASASVATTITIATSLTASTAATLSATAVVAAAATAATLAAVTAVAALTTAAASAALAATAAAQRSGISGRERQLRPADLPSSQAADHWNGLADCRRLPAHWRVLHGWSRVRRLDCSDCQAVLRVLLLSLRAARLLSVERNVQRPSRRG